jgi:hypothetical protein
MKQIVSIGLVFLTLTFSACSHKKSGKPVMTAEDSLKIQEEIYHKVHMKELQKVRDSLIGPIDDGSAPSVKRGDAFKTSLLDDSTQAITAGFEKLKAKLDLAQKDSSTSYGTLMTRFRQFDTQEKYLTATYTDEAHILRYTSEISFDDKHEEERDFYFNNGVLVFFTERHTFNVDEQDRLISDSYFIRDGKVAYAFRDEGNAPQIRDKINLLTLRRFALTGNLTAHVAKEFADFKHDYEILISQPLEQLIYTEEAEEVTAKKKHHQ